MAEKISIKQAAERLGVNSSTIRNWIKLGKIANASRDGENGRFQLRRSQPCSGRLSPEPCLI